MTRYIQRGDPPLPHLDKERVDAIQWTGANLPQLQADFPDAAARLPSDGNLSRLIVSVSGGELFLRVGEWLIRTKSGAVHAMFRDAFNDRYELEAP